MNLADNVTDFLHDTLIASLEASRSTVEDIRILPVADPSLERVHTAALWNPEYSFLKHSILKGFPEHRHKLSNIIRPYWGVRHLLTLDDDMIMCGTRLVIPASLR